MDKYYVAFIFVTGLIVGLMFVRAIKAASRIWDATSEEREGRRHLWTQLILVLAMAVIIYLGSGSPIVKGNPDFANFLRVLGVSGLTLFLVNLLLELPDIRNYNERLLSIQLKKALIFDTSFLKNISRDKLEDAHANIVRILNGSTFYKNGAFYRNLRTQVEPLLGKIHYEKAKLIIKNQVVEYDGVKYIQSNRWIRYEFHTRCSERIDLGYGRMLKTLPGINDQEIYKLNYLCIDGQTPLIDKKKGIMSIQAESVEKEGGRISFKVPLIRDIEVVDEQRGKHVAVERDETVLLPLTDVYIWTVEEGKSLRDLDVEFSFKEEACPRIYVFGFPDSNVQAAVMTDKEIHLSWSGWMLPHHGFFITWDNEALNQ